MGNGFLRIYFDRIYNPVYDLTTARLALYRALHDRCLDLLALRESDTLLCVGLGTGNELVGVGRRRPGTRATGVDFSPAALRRAGSKLRRAGFGASLRIMDARRLDLRDGSFGRVLCIHVLDFVDQVEQVCREIVRVLEPGGRFVLTLPSRGEDAALGVRLASDHFRRSLRSGRRPLGLALDTLLRLPLGLLYLPLMMRPGQRGFSPDDVPGLFQNLPVSDLLVEEERTYQDLIVTGVKSRSRR